MVERADPVELILDVDATLIEIHSEHKQQAAAHFKGGFGFHRCWCSANRWACPWRGVCGRAMPTPTTPQTSYR